MVERQDTNPNTTLNGYIMEFWRFDLTWKAQMSNATKIRQKEQKETTKRRRIILNHNGPKVNLQLNT